MGTADTPKLCGACGAMHPSTAPCTTTSGLTGYPAQPQPRGEGDAEKTRGYTREDIQANTWWPGKGGEGDDLAARTVQIIRNRAKIAREQGTTEAQIIRARALDEAANEFADILPALRTSTEQGGAEARVQSGVGSTPESARPCDPAPAQEGRVVRADEAELVLALEQQAASYRDGTNGAPKPVAAWLRALADNIDPDMPDELFVDALRPDEPRTLEAASHPSTEPEQPTRADRGEG